MARILRGGLPVALGCALLTALAGAHSAGGQTAAGARAGAAAETRLEVLPVTVTDKKGKLVTGLGKGDFTLTQDGRPQTIESFDVGANVPLTLGLLFDTGAGMREVLEKERSASKSLLNQLMVRPEDKGFLLHFDAEVELLEDFTPSKEKLERAIDVMGSTNAKPESLDKPTGTHVAGGTTLYDALYLASDELMRRQKGRKALVLFSDGEDRNSKELLSSAIEAAQRAEVPVYTVYLKGAGRAEQQEYEPSNGGGRRGGMGGGGYPGGGYPGSRTPRPQSVPRIDGKKIMGQIAFQTGGRYFEAKKKENLDEIYGLIAEELRTQYVLRYTPDRPASADSEGTTFHKVLVTTTRKDVTVQTRPGYYVDR